VASKHKRRAMKRGKRRKRLPENERRETQKEQAPKGEKR
jgi:hypothetical protein